MVIRWAFVLVAALLFSAAAPSRSAAVPAPGCGANRMDVDELGQAIELLTPLAPLAARALRLRLRPPPRRPDHVDGRPGEDGAYLCALEVDVRTLAHTHGVDLPSDRLQAQLGELEAGASRLLLRLPRSERIDLANDFLEAADPRIARRTRIDLFNILLDQTARRLAGDPSPSCRFDPLAPEGYLTLAVDPPVQVYWGGRRVGETPLNAIELPSGCLELELREQGTGRRRHLRVDLRPQQLFILRTPFDLPSQVPTSGVGSRDTP